MCTGWTRSSCWSGTSSRGPASEFGVITTSADSRQVVGFLEKPASPPGLPGDPGKVFASMGNYVFTTKVLLDALQRDAEDEDSVHDMGGSILPMLTDRGQAAVYDFDENLVPGETERDHGYWRDVGTIDAYYDANMDLRSVAPALNLYNRNWPLRTASYPEPPAKFTFDEQNRRGEAIDSIVSGGCLLSGGAVRNSVLFRGVKVHAGAVVEDCLLLDNCDIGRRARVRRAILDKNVRVPADACIGYDPEHDRRYHHVTDSGIVVVEGNRSSVEVATLVV